MMMMMVVVSAAAVVVVVVVVVVVDFSIDFWWDFLCSALQHHLSMRPSTIAVRTEI